MEVDEEGEEQREEDEEVEGRQEGRRKFEFQRRPSEMVGCCKGD